MTTATDNTERARSSMTRRDNPAFGEFLDLETMINDAQCHANALNIILAHTLTRTGYRASEAEAEAICHLAAETLGALDGLWREWNDGHDRLHGRAA